MEKPEPGEEFSAKIDRISGSGNGIIELESSHINVGPVKQDSVGEEIVAVMHEDGQAHCKTESVREPERKSAYRHTSQKNYTSHLSEIDQKDENNNQSKHKENSEGTKSESDETGESIDWLTTMRLELAKYRKNTTKILSLYMKYTTFRNLGCKNSSPRTTM